MFVRFDARGAGFGRARCVFVGDRRGAARSVREGFALGGVRRVAGRRGGADVVLRDRVAGATGFRGLATSAARRRWLERTRLIASPVVAAAWR